MMENNIEYYGTFKMWANVCWWCRGGGDMGGGFMVIRRWIYVVRV